MTEKELFYMLSLQRASMIGDITAKKILQYFGDAEQVFRSKRSDLLKIDGIGLQTVRGLHSKDNFEAAENEMKYISDHHINVLSYTDASYPSKLKHCIDGPILMFSKGRIDLSDPGQKIISVVGTRKVTSYGVDFCNRLIEELALFNPIIVSGFAYGTDIVAHRAAMKHDLQTIACMAHGLNQIYPKVHAKYEKQMEENGGFMTDFWSTDDPERNNFLRRNRIIAGMADATIVIESAAKGGSLVTADIANSYNREVFAVPGRATDTYSEGCINLIKSQKAHVLTAAADLVYMMGWDLETVSPQKNVQKQLFVELTNDEQKVYDYLEQKNKEIVDVIALECSVPVHKLHSILFNMEMKGVVRPLPGKLFELV